MGGLAEQRELADSRNAATEYRLGAQGTTSKPLRDQGTCGWLQQTGSHDAAAICCGEVSRHDLCCAGWSRSRSRTCCSGQHRVERETPCGLDHVGEAARLSRCRLPDDRFSPIEKPAMGEVNNGVSWTEVSDHCASWHSTGSPLRRRRSGAATVDDAEGWWTLSGRSTRDQGPTRAPGSQVSRGRLLWLAETRSITSVGELGGGAIRLSCHGSPFGGRKRRLHGSRTVWPSSTRARGSPLECSDDPATTLRPCRQDNDL